MLVYQRVILDKQRMIYIFYIDSLSCLSCHVKLLDGKSGVARSRLQNQIPITMPQWLMAHVHGSKWFKTSSGVACSLQRAILDVFQPLKLMQNKYG